MDALMNALSAMNDVLWHEFVLYAVLATGVLFTLWSGFSQYRALTHGVALIGGKYTREGAPGAINQFQALSAALSATVGLGNIGGVAVAVALGGPGAVFWMWVVGLVGMAIKTTEVTLAMLHRNVDDPNNPHGGPMWVAKHGFAALGKAWRPVGVVVGGIFCVTLLVSTITGGNMFQAWNVGIVTEVNFGVAPLVTGGVLAVLVALVIIGGIKRIGAVAGKLVPIMCGIYMAAALYVIAMNLDAVPGAFGLIIDGAFGPLDADRAFLGGTFGYAFLWGMKRALFSNEAGQGSSPIAHSAAQTHEPVSEGVVAGLEPFIDTLVVCTLTALVILVSGAWNRGPEGTFEAAPALVEVADGTWSVAAGALPDHVASEWSTGTDNVFLIVHTQREDDTGTDAHRLMGSVRLEGDEPVVTWESVASDGTPRLEDSGVYADYPGAALTSHAFDREQPGLGKWIVTLAAWLFAISTMISWSYYGEQGVVYLVGQRGVFVYKLAYCALIVVACSGFITTDAALDTLSSFGTGVMLFANIPIMLIFGHTAMRAYHAYIGRLKRGELVRSESAKRGNEAS